MTKTFIDDPRLPFFDQLALKWNSMQDLPRQEARLALFLQRVGLATDERVIDIGCGTGTLTRVLLRHLSEVGSVVAVDFSSKMLELAQQAVADARVTWLHAAAEATPLADASVDHVICYSAWPHFRTPTKVLAEWRRLLRPGGAAHVLHLISRQAVNDIHSGAMDHAIHHDLLVPVAELASLFNANGFAVNVQEEDEEHYLLSAIRV